MVLPCQQGKTKFNRRVKMKQKDNQVVSTILARASCRNFTDQAITIQQIRTILRAGQAAPSAKNRQPWFFIVIRNQEIQDKIAELAIIGRKKQFSNLSDEKARRMISKSGKFTSNDGVISQADAAILVLRHSDPRYSEGLPQNLDIKEEEGVACCTYSMMLAAESLGLGSVWISSVLNIQTELKKLLEKYLSDQNKTWQKNWQPRAILCLGYPRMQPQKPKRKELSEVTLFFE